MKEQLKVLVSAIALSGSLIASSFPFAHAAGALDGFDPCIKGQNDFRDLRGDTTGRYQKALAATQSATATPAFENDLLTTRRPALRAIFDKQFGNVLKNFPSAMQDQAFDNWVADLRKTPEFRQSINENYRKSMQLAILRQQSTSEANLDAAQRELDKACPADVANQLLRASLSLIDRPLGGPTSDLVKAREALLFHDSNGEVSQIIRDPIQRPIAIVQGIRDQIIPPSDNGEGAKIIRDPIKCTVGRLVGSCN
jgi:hypothetical protein